MLNFNDFISEYGIEGDEEENLKRWIDEIIYRIIESEYDFNNKYNKKVDILKMINERIEEYKEENKKYYN